MELASVAGTVLDIVVMVFSIIFVGGLAIGGTWFYLRSRRYGEYKCIIFEKDGFGQTSYSTDSAGIYIDKKTNNKRFYMKKNQVGLSPDNIPYVQQGKTKLVFMQRVGLKNFKLIKINMEFNPDFQVGEEDVNWAVNSFDKYKKMYVTSPLMQFMPYIMIAFTTIIILVIFIYFFKSFDTLKEVMMQGKEMMQYIAQAKAGTTVIPGG
jgi:hypothetical protein